MPVKQGLVIWFTGLSSAGKTTLAAFVRERLSERGLEVEHLDGDVVRRHLGAELGFSKQDRDENIRRIAYLAGILSRHGVTTIVSAISPYRQGREEARLRVGAPFVEVFVNAPLEICERRDVKGLYRKSHAGLLRGLTGVDDPYEAPLDPEVECRTAVETIEQSAAKVLAFIDPLLAAISRPGDA